MKNPTGSVSFPLDDFLPLSSFGHWFHASRAWWVCGLVAGLLLASCWCALQEPRYGLDMLIRVGQAGRKAVELPYATVARLRSQDFRYGVMQSLHTPAPVHAEWKATVLRDTDIVRVHVSGRLDDVAPVAAAVLERLVVQHDTILQPMQQAMQKLLATPACQADRMVLPPRDAGTDAVDGAAILALSQQDGYGLPCAMELKMQTTYPNTRATALLEPVVAMPERESDWAKFTVLGMVSGALAGFLLFLACHLFRSPVRQ